MTGIGQGIPHGEVRSPAFLSVKNLSKSFGSAKVLKDVSLDVRQGEVVVLLGRSGSGKSTILRCVSGLEEIDGGQIALAGVAAGNPTDLHGRVGFVFQQFNLFPHLTAIENVALGLRWVKKLDRATANARALAALRDVGLQDHANKKPARLSGGQQQRVAIARSVVMDPKLMLFDEATSALDRELVAEVLSAIRGLAQKGMTMLIVTHELHFAEMVADRIIFMHEGEIVEDGPAKDVIASPSSESFRQFLNALSAPEHIGDAAEEVRA